MDLVISLEFTRKQVFKLKKIRRPIYKKYNKKELIKYTVEVSIFYKRHKKRTKIDVIKG